MSLTQGQQALVAFFRDTILRTNQAPTFEEIAKHFDSRSAATIHQDLAALGRRGLIHRSSLPSQDIERATAGEEHFAADGPFEIVENPDWVELPAGFVTDRQAGYVLRVRGDSMIEENFRDGDLIIVTRRDQADEGQTVVALIDEQETTIKKFYRDGGRIRLQPANSRMEAMSYETERVQIQGIVVGLLRKYDGR